MQKGRSGAGLGIKILWILTRNEGATAPVWDQHFVNSEHFSPRIFLLSAIARCNIGVPARLELTVSKN